MSERLEQQHTLGPAVAGTWYPADREGLERLVDGLLDRPGTAAVAGRPVLALIAPHAGFAYSGAVAAAGFRLLQNDSCERVVLLGPSHYAAFEGGAAPAARCYRTPLGDVPLDTEAIAWLGSRPGIRVDDAPFRREHSLEAEIPFLQRTLGGDWRLVPVLIGGGSSAESIHLVAEALKTLVGPRAPVVVSSDFTHFGRRFDFVPFTDEIPARIRELDMGAVEHILAGNRAAFQAYVRRTGATICGKSAIDALLHLLPAETASSLVAYDTSGAITGDWDHSVSYASLVFHEKD